VRALPILIGISHRKLVLTTIVLALAMANGTAMAVEMEDGISIPPEFPGMINNCSGLYRICLPTGDITLEADNTSGFCTWTYNIIWGDGAPARSYRSRASPRVHLTSTSTLAFTL
jgi:hypothetical protein